jgi:hypothetical protein
MSDVGGQRSDVTIQKIPPDGDERQSLGGGYLLFVIGRHALTSTTTQKPIANNQYQKPTTSNRIVTSNI